VLKFSTKKKSWVFGKNAKRLPVLWNPNDETAGGCVSARKIEDSAVARRFPSSTVPETLGQIIDYPARHLVKKRREWDIHKLSRLYAGEFYNVPETRELIFENCWVHIPSATLITSRKEVIGCSTLDLRCLYSGHSTVDWESVPIIEEETFLLATCWGSNYAHWAFDSLPRLSDHITPEAKLLLGLNTPSFQTESLLMLGWNAQNLILPQAELVKCRRLRIHMAAKVSGVPHPECIRKVRDQITAAVGTTKSPSRRIYISRQKTRRSILNHDEIAPILKSYGFEEVFCEELSFSEQVQLFSGAEAIFGPHGAGTINAMFAAKGAALIEAFNPQVWDHAAHRVASLCGVSHFHLFGINANKSYDMILDPKILERTLALALNDPDSPNPALLESNF
jgi:hypothetical protein